MSAAIRIGGIVRVDDVLPVISCGGIVQTRRCVKDISLGVVGGIEPIAKLIWRERESYISGRNLVLQENNTTNCLLSNMGFVHCVADPPKELGCRWSMTIALGGCAG